MNLVKIKYFLSFIAIIAMSISGCGTEILISPIVTGVVHWVNGESHKYYENESDVIYRSTKHALRELDQEIKKDVLNDNQYEIIAGNENRFAITIEKADKNITRLNIRINYLGDKEFAELIYSKVDQQIDIIEFDPQGNPTKKRFNGFHNQRNF